MKKALFLLVAIAITLFFSCRKSNEKPSWDTELLAPLVNANLNINNLLTNSILQANADSSLKIVYENNLTALTMDTLFKINDTTLHDSYTLPQYVFYSGQTIPIPSGSTTTYQLPGVQLRTIIVKEGKVIYTIQNTIHHPIDFHYSIPSASINGTVFSIDVTVPGAVGSNPGVYSQQFNLAGYTIDLTGPSHNMVNTIATSLLVNITSNGDSAHVNTGDYVKIDNTFSGLVPYYALGYFGQNTVNIGPATSDFTLFNRIVSGSLGLENVTLDFKLENPIGLDARMYINNLASVNTRTNTAVVLHAPSLIYVPININRASESNPGGVGTVYPTYADYPLNTKNSNIKPVIENMPDKLAYNIQIITNPLGNVSGSNDFIYSDQLLKAQLNMEVPLSLVAKDLTLVDTLGLNISTEDGVQNVKSGTITFFANNGFPFDAAIQMYLLNEQNQITDSIFSTINTIDEAPINFMLRATDKKLTKLVVPMSEDKMKLLYATKRIALKIKFNTSAQPNYIKIYSDYSIDVNIVGDFNYTVHL